jgi:26S proteasome regulatory subunit N10
LDNSDWTRNADYLPNRLEAQKDSVNVICGAKAQNNPENVFGVLVMGGKA